jgi:hypothetical protein
MAGAVDGFKPFDAEDFSLLHPVGFLPDPLEARSIFLFESPGIDAGRLGHFFQVSKDPFEVMGV